MAKLDEIRAFSPWWLSKEAIGNDKHIKEFSDSSVKWIPDIKEELDLDRDVVYSLRGPRQVGKTTLIKLIIRDLLRGIDPKRIMYYSCDIVTAKELASLLSEYMEWIRSFTRERTFIFLDEISSVKDWQKSIKILYDTGKLEKTTVILTGSHSIDIKRSAELLPGRRGRIEKPDREFLPMNFREYTTLLKSELIGKSLQELKPFIGDLNKLLEQYLITGGFPRVIDSYMKTGKVEEYLFSDYMNWIIGDFRKLGKNDYYLKEILKAVVETMSSPVGWETIQKKTDIGSINTVHEYIDDLKHSFVLEYLLQIDSSKRVSFLKRKKIYIRDPFIYHSIKKFVYNVTFQDLIRSLHGPEEKSKLIEGIVCDHLSRIKELYYWRGKKGTEVDFIVKGKDLLAIEVKYRKSKRYDLGGIMGFRKGLVLTKDELDLKARHPRVPVSLFLLKLDRDLTGDVIQT